jgi:hypothetical protein
VGGQKSKRKPISHLNHCDYMNFFLLTASQYVTQMRNERRKSKDKQEIEGELDYSSKWEPNNPNCKA